MNESTEKLQGPKPGAGFPLTENMIQTGSDARCSPEATGERWQFPGLRGTRFSHEIYQASRCLF